MGLGTFVPQGWKGEVSQAVATGQFVDEGCGDMIPVFNDMGEDDGLELFVSEVISQPR